VCETGDDEVTVRIYDDEGEPFTLARVLENEYENIFFVVEDGAGNYCVVETWGELDPPDVIDEDGYMVVDLTDPANWGDGEYQGWEAFLEAAEFWGAGVEEGVGPDPVWYNVLNYRLDGAPTFGDWLDAGSASNEGFGCVEDPCEPAGPPPPTGTISGDHKPLVDGDVTLTAVLFNMLDEDPTYQWAKDGEDLEGETGGTLELLSVTLDDTGEYTCLVTYVEEEGGDAAYAELELSTYVWVTEAGLPLAGGLGLGLLAGACALAGVVSIRRKK
jgi:hypothetical protein